MEISKLIKQIKENRKEIHTLIKCMKNSESENDYNKYNQKKSLLLNKETELKQQLYNLLEQS